MSDPEFRLIFHGVDRGGHIDARGERAFAAQFGIHRDVLMRCSQVLHARDPERGSMRQRALDMGATLCVCRWWNYGADQVFGGILHDARGFT